MKYLQKDLDLENLKTKKQGGKYLLGMLQNLYCSCQSEISSFLLFNFQLQITSDKNIQTKLQKFAKINLDNSKQLSQIIFTLEGTPVYTNSQGIPLNAFWISFETNTKKFLKTDINFLNTLILNYQNYISKISDKKILKSLNMLLEKNKQTLQKLKTLI